MVTQVHELSELLFKVTSGKINDEADYSGFVGEDDGAVLDWDEPFMMSAAA